MKSQPAISSGNQIQSLFLEEVRKRLPAHVSFADELAELLNISRDSAYRRMRGETVLSLDEAKKLYDHYGVSIDALMTSSSNMALFHNRAVNTDYSLERWLNSVNKNLELLNSFESKELLYAAKDVPVFHYSDFRCWLHLKYSFG